MVWSNLDSAERNVEALLRVGSGMKDKRQVYTKLRIRLNAIRRAFILQQKQLQQLQQQQQEGGAL